MIPKTRKMSSTMLSAGPDTTVWRCA